MLICVICGEIKKTPATTFVVITGAKVNDAKIIHHIVHDGLHDDFFNQDKLNRFKKFSCIRRKISVCVYMSVLSSIERFRSLL